MALQEFRSDLTGTASGTSVAAAYARVEPHSHAGNLAASVCAAAFTAAKGAAEAVNEWRWERKTRFALASLDNAILADIGITRSEIPAVARASAKNPTFGSTRRRRWTD